MRKDVYKVLSGAGIPVAHMAFPKGKAPKLPWAVYMLDDDAKLDADNRRWASFSRWRVELYQKSASTEVEEALEKAIADAYGDYDKDETWVDAEDCLMTVYTFTELPKGADNG